MKGCFYKFLRIIINIFLKSNMLFFCFRAYIHSNHLNFIDSLKKISLLPIRKRHCMAIVVNNSLWKLRKRIFSLLISYIHYEFSPSWSHTYQTIYNYSIPNLLKIGRCEICIQGSRFLSHL